MKLSHMLGSRNSRHNSPTPSAPSSPGSTSSCKSPTLSPPKKHRFPKPLMGLSHSKRRAAAASQDHGAAGSHDETQLRHIDEIIEVSIIAPSAVSVLGKGSTRGESSSTATSWQLGKLSEKGMQEIEQVFAQFDANGDGKISSEELQAVLASLGDEPTREEAELMVREVDTDGDGFIDLQEFVEMNRRCLRQAAAEEEIAAAFAVFDLDNNGRITAEDLQAVLRRLGGSMGQRSSVEDCRRMIRGVDRKGVGHVDLDDFKRMMTPLTF